MQPVNVVQNKRKVLDIDEITAINEKFGKPTLLACLDPAGGNENEQPVRKSIRKTSNDSPTKKS